MTNLLSPSDIDTENLAYDHRVVVAKSRLIELPYGSQAQLGYDIRVTSTMISAILAGRYKSPENLAYIEDWLDDPAQARQDAFDRDRAIIGKIQAVLRPNNSPVF